MMINPATGAGLGSATIAEIEGFLKIKGDKRRELFKHWGLPSSRSTSWSELWFAMELDSFQPKKLWGDLQETLLGPGGVAAMLGYTVINMLVSEISPDMATSSRRRAQSALRSVMSGHHRTPENTELSTDIFDGFFPLNGWDP